MVDRSWDGTRMQFQYAGSMNDLGEIGMTSNSGAGKMQLWMGANLSSTGGHKPPTQNNAGAPSWFSTWNTNIDFYSVSRIADGGGSTADVMLYIDDSGNVGIGTTNPGYPLHITDNNSTAIFNIDNEGDDLWTGTRLARDGAEISPHRRRRCQHGHDDRRL
jgi:hypothetical protein